MSEAIMSVAGQLVGIPVEKYSGTNGVTVDQNSKTIGLDETVLYQTSSPVQILYSTDLKLDLNESPYNFEHIKIYYKISFGNGIQIIEIAPTNTTDTFCVGGFWCSNSDGTAILNDSCCGKFLNDKLELTFGSRYQIDRSNNSLGHREDRGPAIVKVIGINRISGGNA